MKRINELVRTTAIAGLSVLAMGLSAQAVAATGTINTTHVNLVLVDGDNFGGCMVLLSANPKTVLPACGNNWISFDCNGDFHDPDLGSRLYEQAQLALVTGRTIRVAFTDEQMHNGYCVGKRVDVRR